MNVGLLLITHGNLGKELLRTVTVILGSCPLPVNALAISKDCNPDMTLKTANALCRKLDKGDGVLVLTDLFGSTPFNIANHLHEKHKVAVIAGVNVPMILRVLNYPDHDLEQLRKKAMSGARDGIIDTDRSEGN
jgi:PTS system ascorbate-specific IIA component